MIRYSNGQTFTKNLNQNNNSNIASKKKNFSCGNRGMNLENDINITNEFYRSKGMCLITKRPTPINVVSVEYKNGPKITNAYFEKPSTTDYNGVYKGRYIDFEAKSTRQTTSFPLANISKHQIEHLKQVILNNGIGFFIVEFSRLEQVFLIDAKYVIEHYENDKRRSIPYQKFLEVGYQIKRGFLPRLFYLDVIKKVYFFE